MRALLQRVRRARVDIGSETVGAIDKGLTVFLGVAKTDTAADAEYLVDKVLQLRIFEDEAGKMNRSLLESGGELLLVSQFTLYGDCTKGRRPSFDKAAGADDARKLYDYFVACARRTGVKTATGVFQADMLVHIENDGPVTVICDSPMPK